MRNRTSRLCISSAHRLPRHPRACSLSLVPGVPSLGFPFPFPFPFSSLSLSLSLSRSCCCLLLSCVVFCCCVCCASFTRMIRKTLRLGNGLIIITNSGRAMNGNNGSSHVSETKKATQRTKQARGGGAQQEGGGHADHDGVKNDRRPARW